MCEKYEKSITIDICENFVRHAASSISVCRPRISYIRSLLCSQFSLSSQTVRVFLFIRLLAYFGLICVSLLKRHPLRRLSAVGWQRVTCVLLFSSCRGAGSRKLALLQGHCQSRDASTSIKKPHGAGFFNSIPLVHSVNEEMATKTQKEERPFFTPRIDAAHLVRRI